MEVLNYKSKMHRCLKLCILIVGLFSTTWIFTCTDMSHRGWVRPGIEPRWGFVAGSCSRRTGSGAWQRSRRPRQGSRQPTNIHKYFTLYCIHKTIDWRIWDSIKRSTVDFIVARIIFQVFGDYILINLNFELLFCSKSKAFAINL